MKNREKEIHQDKQNQEFMSIGGNLAQAAVYE